jgi:hypothetical protein
MSNKKKEMVRTIGLAWMMGTLGTTILGLAYEYFFTTFTLTFERGTLYLIIGFVVFLFGSWLYDHVFRKNPI